MVTAVQHYSSLLFLDVQGNSYVYHINMYILIYMRKRISNTAGYMSDATLLSCNLKNIKISDKSIEMPTLTGLLDISLRKRSNKR